MPRPPAKRRRQNSFGNSFAVRKPVRGPRIPDQTQAREAHEKSLAKKPVGKRPADSDDSDELITSRHGGGRRRKQEIYASGAVANGDKPGAWPTRAQRTRSMREDTEEILSQQSRSRTASRANSVSSNTENAAPPSPPIVKTISQVAKPGQTRKEALGNPMQNSRPTRLPVNGISNTPQPEASILGKIKPRKRQASILRLIENGNHDTEDSFASDDLSGFSPDAISTPIDNGSRPTSAALGSTASSLKRKRDVQAAPTPRFTPISNSKPTTVTQPTLPTPSRSQRKKLTEPANTTGDTTEDIMALPESSDEENSAPVIAPRVAWKEKTDKNKTFVPSTEQLQNLMPSKRRKIDSSRRTGKTDYDLPTGSDEELSTDDEHEVSIFLPSKRRKVPGRAAASSKPQQAQSMSGRGRGKAPNKAKIKVKDQAKSTKAVPKTQTHTPSPVRLRTPRPLTSSSTLQESQAKTPSKQGTIINPSSRNVMGDKDTNPVVRVAGGSTKKQYGGSRNMRRGVGAGKENQGSARPSSNGPLRLDEHSNEGTLRAQVPHVQTAEGRVWSKKWADIDDFSLDFEEVSASTRSSSPMAR